jgi:hypothetical protein
LFDPQLPVLAQKVVNPGEQSLLYNVARVTNKAKPQVLAGAARVYNEQTQSTSYSFVAKSPIKTLNSMRVLLPAKPKTIKVTDSKGQEVKDVKTSWDASSNTIFLGFANDPGGVNVGLSW